MELIWECMVIAFKGFIGTFIWILALMILFIIIGLIAKLINEMNEHKEPKEPPKKIVIDKPEYDGQPIILQGGKKNGKEEPS